jgi:enamine deaminase RidA (YjgF/YER057c/UK114 family)
VSGVRQLHLATRANEEVGAELGLELPDRDAQRRLCHVQADGRAAEVELLRDRHEVPQMAKLGHAGEGYSVTDTGSVWRETQSVLPSIASSVASPLMLAHLNPGGLRRNPAFSQAVRVEPGAALVFIGGQNGVDADGQLVDGMNAQTVQALRNVAIAAEAGGSSLERVVKWTMLVARDAPIGEALAAFGEVWGDRGAPPAITVALVGSLANPAFLIEIEAVAVAPEK